MNQSLTANFFFLTFVAAYKTKPNQTQMEQSMTSFTDFDASTRSFMDYDTLARKIDEMKEMDKMKRGIITSLEDRLNLVSMEGFQKLASSLATSTTDNKPIKSKRSIRKTISASLGFGGGGGSSKRDHE